MAWSASLRLGSGTLADAYLRSDPPAARELDAVRQHVGGAFEGLDIPPAELAVAVGGSATSLRRLVGALLEPETLERGLRVLAGTPVADVARTYELDPERVRLLPAGILILEEASTRLGLPLQIARGGLREGVILEMMDSRAAPEADGQGPRHPRPQRRRVRSRDAAAKVVAVRAQELVDHADNVLDTTDIERVHDMRVATRRLRAVLEIFAPCFPKRPAPRRAARRQGAGRRARRAP